MSDRELHTLLTELHQSLKDIPVRNDAQPALDELASYIKPIVESGAAGPIPGGHVSGLRERLDAAMAAVEVTHPQLAQTIGRVADTLAFYNL